MEFRLPWTTSSSTTASIGPTTPTTADRLALIEAKLDQLLAGLVAAGLTLPAAPIPPVSPPSQSPPRPTRIRTDKDVQILSRATRIRLQRETREAMPAAQVLP